MFYRIKISLITLLLLLLNATIVNAQVKIYPSLKSTKETFWRDYATAKEYFNTNIEHADSISKQLLTTCELLNDSARFYATLLDVELDKIRGFNVSYFNKIPQIIAFEHKLKSFPEQLEINKKKIDLLIKQRNFVGGETLALKTLPNAKKARDNRGISELYNFLATSKMHQNDKDSALFYINESIQYARRSANKSVQARAFHVQAIIYHHFGQIELSVSKDLFALQLAQNDKLFYQQAKYALTIGESQLSIRNYKEAMFYFNQVIQLAKQIKDQHLVGIAKVYIGMVYFQEKNYTKALENKLVGLKILSTFEDDDALGLVYNALGDYHRELKEYQKAASNYNKALVYYEASGNKERIATVYLNVGIVFEKQQKYTNALNYLNRSVEIFSEFGYQNAVANAYHTISEIYQKQHDYPTAFRYLKMYTNIVDSAKIIESSAKIAELNETYRSEQRERVIASQADSIQRQQQDKALTATKLENYQLKNNMKSYVILGFSILVLLAGIIIFYRWNQSNLAQKQKEAEMNQTLLRTQMNPHFVFNAMSVIQSYIYDNDTNNSTKFLVGFSKLMRLILENSSKEFIAMQTEIDILDKYLSIQKLRFEDRFEYTIDVEDALIEAGAVIPPMITQPFIENALEHGRLHLKEDGYIHINYKIVSSDKMLISIIDNGIGRKKAELNKKGSDHKSMAMKITKERIDILNKKYRKDGSIVIEDYNKEEETGTVVLISIPFKINPHL